MQVLQRTTSGPERISTLTEALSAANFVVLLAAVRELCGYDETSHSFNKGCNAILKSQAAKTGNSVLKEQALAFQDVFDADWNDYILSCALQSIESTRRNQPKLLPSCKDVEKLYIYLKGKAAASSDETYADLAQRTLCQITLLNRKRGGEVQIMTKVDYQQGLARQADVDPVILESLEAMERKFAEVLERIEIRGKFGLRVGKDDITSPCLFASKEQNALQRIRCDSMFCHGLWRGKPKAVHVDNNA